MREREERGRETPPRPLWACASCTTNLCPVSIFRICLFAHPHTLSSFASRSITTAFSGAVQPMSATGEGGLLSGGQRRKWRRPRPRRPRRSRSRPPRQGRQRWPHPQAGPPPPPPPRPGRWRRPHRPARSPARRESASPSAAWGQGPPQQRAKGCRRTQTRGRSRQ